MRLVSIAELCRECHLTSDQVRYVIATRNVPTMRISKKGQPRGGRPALRVPYDLFLAAMLAKGRHNAY